MNFNDHTVTWDTDTIPMNDIGTLSSVEALIEMLFIWVQMNHKCSEMNILELPKKQHQLKLLLQNMNVCLMEN
jgi:hypothetical protein